MAARACCIRSSCYLSDVFKQELSFESIGSWKFQPFSLSAISQTIYYILITNALSRTEIGNCYGFVDNKQVLSICIRFHKKSKGSSGI